MIPGKNGEGSPRTMPARPVGSSHGCISHKPADRHPFFGEVGDDFPSPEIWQFFFGAGGGGGSASGAFPHFFQTQPLDFPWL